MREQTQIVNEMNLTAAELRQEYGKALAMVALPCPKCGSDEIVKNWMKIAPVIRDLIATLTARCEALEQENKRLTGEHEFVRGLYIQVKDRYVALEELFNSRVTELQQLRVRCEVLTAERDTLQQVADLRQATIASWGRIGAERATKIAELESRCQHLEQAVQDIIAADFLQVEGVRQPIWVRWNEALRIANAALASLLPAQEEGAKP